MKHLIAQVIFRKWKSIKEFTGIRPILILLQTLLHFLFNGSEKYRHMNRKGKKVDKLLVVDESWNPAPVSQDLLKNNSLTRFDPPENKNPSKTRNITKEKTEDLMIRRRNKYSSILILTFLLLLTSCNNNVVYTDSFVIPDKYMGTDECSCF